MKNLINKIEALRPKNIKNDIDFGKDQMLDAVLELIGDYTYPKEISEIHTQAFRTKSKAGTFFYFMDSHGYMCEIDFGNDISKSRKYHEDELVDLVIVVKQDIFLNSNYILPRSEQTLMGNFKPDAE